MMKESLDLGGERCASHELGHRPEPARRWRVWRCRACGQRSVGTSGGTCPGCRGLLELARRGFFTLAEAEREVLQ